MNLHKLKSTASQVFYGWKMVSFPVKTKDMFYDFPEPVGPTNTILHDLLCSTGFTTRWFRLSERQENIPFGGVSSTLDLDSI
jgi:hypothetical protein